MVMMASARDLVSVFVALEFLSIPAYMLAAWRKRDLKSNEAGVKYFLLGVFASAVMLYGMSLLYGVANSTLLVDIAKTVSLKASSLRCKHWLWYSSSLDLHSRSRPCRSIRGRPTRTKVPPLQ
jgi:NADH:ubiquinone oxidoreductase subunit 2 (subunit N)